MATALKSIIEALVSQGHSLESAHSIACDALGITDTLEG